MSGQTPNSLAATAGGAHAGAMDRLTEHYRQRVEGTRLSAGNGRVEFLRTQELLRAVLPPRPARVMDVGGADGVHAEWLVRDGYEVAVVDPLEDHVARARGQGLDAQVGDARSLAFDDASADAVLLLGPLYHLHDPGDRVLALREAKRVVRSGGLVAVAAISRVSVLLDGLRKGFVADPGWLAGVHRVMDHGADPHDRAIEVFYFHTPDGLTAELHAAGFGEVAVRGVEGPAWAMIDRHLPPDDPRIGHVIDIARLADREPSTVGASAHLLALAIAP